MSALSPKAACPLCRETRRRWLFVKDGFPVVRCRGCRLVYVDAEITSSDLASRYGEDYYRGGVFHDYVGQRDQRLASARSHCELLSRLQPSGRLLDVGCATGFFLEAASARWEVVGVELSAFAADYARGEFGQSVLTGDIADVGLPDAAFNVVTLWNTIEHVSDPRETIGQVARVAAPNALVVLTTGDVTGPRARRDLSNWDLMSPPEHLYFFSPKTITRLLEDAGLEVRRIVHDGLIATSRPLSSSTARAIASAAGLGNVMTVYARRTHGRDRRPAPRAVLARRVRPVTRA
jgi:SAM-dependent methyltransferase